MAAGALKIHTSKHRQHIKQKITQANWHRLCICIYINMYMPIFIYIYIYLLIYLFIYLFIYCIQVKRTEIYALNLRSKQRWVFLWSRTQFYSFWRGFESDVYYQTTLKKIFEDTYSKNSLWDDTSHKCLP